MKDEKYGNMKKDAPGKNESKEQWPVHGTISQYKHKNRTLLEIVTT